MSNQGQCPKCSTQNEYSKTVCDMCGARLPWASALEEDRKQKIAAEKVAEDAKRQLAQAQRASNTNVVSSLPNIPRPLASNPAGSPSQKTPPFSPIGAAGNYICESCGMIGKPRKYEAGNDWLGCVLGLALLIPGLIYMMWNASKRYQGCSSCKSRAIIDLNSPKGQMLVQHYYPAENS